MSLSIGEMKIFGMAAYSPALLQNKRETYSEIYDCNRHRVYSLAFWMTDNELAAEQLMTDTFCSAFAVSEEPTADDIDRALVAELRQYIAIGTLILNCAPCDQVLSVRCNAQRVDLERAMIELPNTEKMIFVMHDVLNYDYARVAFLIGISETNCRLGSHQARLRMRELLAK